MADTKTRSRILSSAIKLFGKHGKAAVSTADIARDAKVNKALIFYHFSSKDELYRTAFLTQLREFAERIRGKMSEAKPGLPAVETFIRSHIAIISKNKHMARMLARELLYSNEPKSAALVKDFAEVLKVIRNEMLRALSSAQSSGHLRDIDPLQTFVSIVSVDIFFFLGLPLVRMLNPDINLNTFEEQRIDHVVDILMNGIRRKQE